MIRDDSGVIEHRYDTKENWAAANPLLAKGELGIEASNGVVKIKVGDGIQHWNDLEYASAGLGTEGIRYGTLTIGNTYTLSEGQAATVTNSGTIEDAILNFGIPKGNPGKDGVTPDITLEVATGAAGSNAVLTKAGTLAAPVFVMEIPRGDKGEKGDPGLDGNGDVSSKSANTFTETNTFNSVLKTTCDMQRYSTKNGGGKVVFGYDSDNNQTLIVGDNDTYLQYMDESSNMTGYKKTFILTIVRRGIGVFSLWPVNRVNGKDAYFRIMNGDYLPDTGTGELLKLGLEIDTEFNVIYVHILGEQVAEL